MGHKKQGICPMTAAVLIRNEAKRRGISLNVAILQQARELDVPVETIRNWIWPERKISRRDRFFWERVLGQLRAGAKAVRLHGGEYPLDDETRGELKALIRYLGEFLVRAELEAGLTHIPEEKDDEERVGNLPQHGDNPNLPVPVER